MRGFLEMVVVALATGPFFGCIEPAAATDSVVSEPFLERSCQDGVDCLGHKCLKLGPNAQGLSGVCSATCGADADCGPGGVCFVLGEAGSSCLSRCGPESSCTGGLTCTVVGADGERACFATADGVPGA